MTDKRYEFTGETKTLYGRTVHQIRALVAITALHISIGDVGGYIEVEDNLPHNGTAWVFPNAIVCGAHTVLWGGTFEGGTFEGGTFRGGAFRGGTFRGGTFEGGTFEGGTFEGGTFRGGAFRGGTFEGGTFWGGNFWGGTFEGGTFRGGAFRGGTFRGGTFWGGNFWGGTFEGGTFRGGTFWGGTFEGGTFRGGTFRGGTFRLEDTTNKQPLYLAGLTWEVTITDTHMGIGCQHHPLKNWWRFDDRIISRMDSDALTFWKQHKPVLVALCEANDRVEVGEVE